jgi:hypothetical protein
MKKFIQTENNKMKRREFIRKSIQAGTILSASLTFPGFINNFVSKENSSSLPYDLVAIKGGEPDKMFDEGIKSLGGIKTFVKKNPKIINIPSVIRIKIEALMNLGILNFSR